MNETAKTVLATAVVTVAAIYAVDGLAKAAKLFKKQSAIKKAAKNA